MRMFVDIYVFVVWMRWIAVVRIRICRIMGDLQDWDDAVHRPVIADLIRNPEGRQDDTTQHQQTPYPRKNTAKHNDFAITDFRPHNTGDNL